MQFENIDIEKLLNERKRIQRPPSEIESNAPILLQKQPGFCPACLLNTLKFLCKEYLGVTKVLGQSHLNRV